MSMDNESVMADRLWPVDCGHSVLSTSVISEKKTPAKNPLARDNTYI